MGLYIMKDLDEENFTFFASWGGMKELTQFIEANAKKFPVLAEFSNKGTTDKPRQLALEAEKAALEADEDNARILKTIAEVAFTAELQVTIT